MATDTSPITHRQVWMLAGPMIISNISVPLVGAVDTAVVGHLPEIHYIGAVAIGALVFSFLYWGFGFLKMGITGFVARAFGRNDELAIFETVLRFLLLGMALGLLVIALRNPLIDFALFCIDSSENVETLAGDYCLIRVWSAPATFCIYVFTGIFVGLHNTKLALALQLVLNLTNIALDLLFVPVLQLGVPGVAWATLIAEYTAAGVGFLLLRKTLIKAINAIDWKQLFEFHALKGMMQTNGNLFIRTLCVVFSFAFFTAQSARHGELILAANAVLLHLQTVMAYALDGFAHSVEALGGSAYGAGNAARFRRAVFLTTLWSGLTTIVISVAYFVAGDTIIGWFTDTEIVVQTASEYLIWMILSPIVSFSSFQLDGLFVGTGRAREMRNAMLVSMAGYIGTAYLFQIFWGNHGLFLALVCLMIFRTMTLSMYYPSIIRSMNPK